MICDRLGRKYGIGIKVLPMPEKADIPEDGNSYLENSSQKALWIWRRYGKSCFADDSGMEVAALGGAPGIHTARYCDRNFANGMDKLLHELDMAGAVTPEQRKAAFKCCITLILSPEDAPQGVQAGEVLAFEGCCSGRISDRRCGSAGFGFDPVFIADAAPGLCMAELDDEKKNSISHRALALEEMFRYLADHK